MAWDLITAKQYLSIPAADTTQDANIQVVLNRVLATVETLLQRKLFLAREIVKFYHLNDRKVLLPRYPIVNVFSINGVTSQTWLVHHRNGWVDLCTTNVAAGKCGGEIAIDYEGGYGTLPPDLEGALWEIFMLAWSGIDPNTGGPSQSGGLAVVQGSGDVKSLTVFDAFKVDYDVGTSVSGSSSSSDSLTDEKALWGWLAPWATVLSFYRSEQGVGLGIA